MAAVAMAAATAASATSEPKRHVVSNLPINNNLDQLINEHQVQVQVQVLHHTHSHQQPQHHLSLASTSSPSPTLMSSASSSVSSVVSNYSNFNSPIFATHTTPPTTTTPATTSTTTTQQDTLQLPQTLGFIANKHQAPNATNKQATNNNIDVGTSTMIINKNLHQQPQIEPSNVHQTSINQQQQQLSPITQHRQYPPNHPLSNSKHLCLICGDKATGKHYGVFSCEGCKGFFKRTIRKDIVYACRASGSCLIDTRQRNRCQYCRYQKCLRKGMKREAVQEEKQRLNLKAKTTKQQTCSSDDMIVDNFEQNYPNQMNTHLANNLNSQQHLDYNNNQTVLSNEPNIHTYDNSQDMSQVQVQAQKQPIANYVGSSANNHQNHHHLQVSHEAHFLQHHHQQQQQQTYNYNNNNHPRPTTNHDNSTAPNTHLINSFQGQHVVVPTINQQAQQNINHINQLQTYNNQQCDSLENLYLNFYKPNKILQHNTSNIILNNINGSVNPVSLRLSCKFQVEQLVELAISVPKFQQLLLDDQVTLLKAYWNELIISDLAFKSVDFYTKNQSSNRKHCLCIGQGVLINEEQAHDIGLGNMFGRIIAEIVAKLYVMRVDSTELACLCAIILLNPETQGLKSSQPIENLRSKVYAALEKYCDQNHRDQPTRFGKLLLRLPSLRSIGLKCDSRRSDTNITGTTSGVSCHPATIFGNQSKLLFFDSCYQDISADFFLQQSLKN